MSIPLSFTLAAPRQLDLGRTLGSLRLGVSDPCWRVDAAAGAWMWATRTPVGPLTMRLRLVPPDDGGETATVAVDAWGEGAEWAEVIAPAVAGTLDHPEALATEHPGLRRLADRFAGFRLARSARVADAAIAGVCARGVSAFEAARSWALLVEAMGDDAPGPGGLRLPAAPRRVSAAEPYDLHVMGLEQGRADEVRRIASHANRLELSGSEPGSAVIDRLRGIAGLGSDAIDHARSVALGHPDAVPVVDAHHVAALVRVLRGGDASGTPHLGDLLEPFRPQRGRVVRLIGLAASDGDHAGGATP